MPALWKRNSGGDRRICSGYVYSYSAKKEGEAQDRLTTAANPENGVSASPTNGIVQQETPSVKNGISETEETSVGLEYSAI